MDSTNEQVVQDEQQTESGDITIDLGRIFLALWHYLWVIVLATILGAAIMFGYTKIFVTEMYTTSATIYVSNTNSETISSSDSNVANVVSALITDYDTIEDAREYAEETYGIKYTHGQYSGSISTSVGSSGLLTLTVEYSDPQDAANIANSILAILSDRSTEIYKGDIYVKAYSEARVPSSPSSPNTTRNVLIGALAGLAISCVVIVLVELLNNKIYNSEYLTSTYNIPVLTEIPDFADKKSGKKGYYSKYGYGYGYGYGEKS